MVDCLANEKSVAGQGENANQGSNGNVALNPAPEMQGLQRGTNAVKKKRGDRENQRSHDFLINHCSDWGIGAGLRRFDRAGRFRAIVWL